MFKKLWNVLIGLFNKKSKEVVETAKETVRGWTDEQVEELKKLHSVGISKERICELTGRTMNSINYKIADIFGTSKVVK